MRSRFEARIMLQRSGLIQIKDCEKINMQAIFEIAVKNASREERLCEVQIIML